MKKVKWTTTILIKAMALIMLISVFSCDDDDDGNYGNIDNSTSYKDLAHRKREMNCYV